MNISISSVVAILCSAAALWAADSLPRIQPKLVDDKPIPEEERESLSGGCSWYCGAPRIDVSASSVLTESSGKPHPAQFAHDDKISTAWAEGSRGDGVGESLSFTFVTTKEDTTNLAVTSLTIFPGYQSTKKLFLQNGRPRTLRLHYDNRPVALLELKDSMGSQTFSIPTLALARPSKHTITMQIVEVYPGLKFEDACISDVLFSGEGDMH